MIHSVFESKKKGRRGKEEVGNARYLFKKKKKPWAHNSAHLVAQKSVVIAEREERVVFFYFWEIF